MEGEKWECTKSSPRFNIFCMMGTPLGGYRRVPYMLGSSFHGQHFTLWLYASISNRLRVIQLQRCLKGQKLSKIQHIWPSNGRPWGVATAQCNTLLESSSRVTFVARIICVCLELRKSYKALKVSERPQTDHAKPLLDHRFGGSKRYRHWPARTTELPSFKISRRSITPPPIYLSLDT